MAESAVFLGVGRDPVEARRVLELEVMREGAERAVPGVAVRGGGRRLAVAVVGRGRCDRAEAEEKTNDPDQAEDLLRRCTPPIRAWRSDRRSMPLAGAYLRVT